MESCNLCPTYIFSILRTRLSISSPIRVWPWNKSNRTPILQNFEFYVLTRLLLVTLRYEIVDHVLALPPFFCQTFNPILTKGTWTPNLMF